jgi:hypothetical protein
MNGHRRPKTGLTLIEVLIGLTMTLIVLGAMMVAFRYASEQISNGRAMMEMSNQLRTAQTFLRSDFAGLTTDVHLGDRNGSPNGYFEYVEGLQKDASYALDIKNAYGDYDDILAMTTRTAGRPFRGRLGALGSISTIESNLAEVIWWTSYDDRNANAILDEDEHPTIRLHCRRLLIRPDLSPVAAPDFDAVRRFFLLNDVSMRWDRSDASNANWRLIPNSLSDLTRRENRFGHAAISIGAGNTSLTYPHLIDRASLQQLELSQTNLNIFGDARAFQYIGQDIMLTNLLAFDVKIFSPNAAIRSSATAGLPLTPDAQGYGGVALDSGAFVDLGYGLVAFDPFNLTLPQFSTLPLARFPIGVSTDVPYCTFSPHYEFDGLDQDGDGAIDEGTNGLDDNNLNGVDDDGELETAPPYPFVARGFQIRMRLVEPNTKQVRETVVVESLLPR